MKDKKYQASIDNMIDAAAKVASDHVGPEPKKFYKGSEYIRPEWTEWSIRWDREFHLTMDFWAAQKGFRRQSYQRE